MKTKSNQSTGALGEEAVSHFLLGREYEIVERNWRVREGEIDIVALNPAGVFCFVEVKTRSSLSFGHPLEAIDRDKAHRLQRLALAWLATHSCLGCEYQIDGAAVMLDSDGCFSIDYREKLL